MVLEIFCIVVFVESFVQYTSFLGSSVCKFAPGCFWQTTKKMIEKDLQNESEVFHNTYSSILHTVKDKNNSHDSEEEQSHVLKNRVETLEAQMKDLQEHLSLMQEKMKQSQQ